MSNVILSSNKIVLQNLNATSLVFPILQFEFHEIRKLFELSMLQVFYIRQISKFKTKLTKATNKHKL